MKPMAWIVGVLVAAAWSFAQAEGNVAAGKALYATCAACHGQNGEGNAALHAPVLAGQASWYIVRQLQHFKAGIRGTAPGDTFGMQMRPMAMTLATEQAVMDVAAYIASLPPVGAERTLDGEPQKGKDHYALCSTCHGQKAQGSAVYHAPRLSHQHDWYLLTQLKHFKAGVRGQAPDDTYGMQMQPVADSLSNEQAMKDVIAYIKSLAD
jgi:cytochrome c oxidase subunit II